MIHFMAGEDSTVFDAYCMHGNSVEEACKECEELGLKVVAQYKNENPAIFLRNLIGEENLSEEAKLNLEIWEDVCDQPGEVFCGCIPKIPKEE